MKNCCGYTANLRDNSRFTEHELGVHADGTFGQMHVDAKVVRLAHQFGFALSEHEHDMLLDADTNNGYAIETWDEIEAWHGLVEECLSHLNDAATEEDVFFEFHEGDLRLSQVED